MAPHGLSHRPDDRFGRRRRVGKILLSLELVARAKEQKYVYFFVAKKSAALLCAEYLQEIKQLFPDAPVREIVIWDRDQ